MKKRADGRYQKSITINGKRQFFYGKSPAEVNKKILAYQHKQEQGRTFKEVADEWTDEHYKTLTLNSLKGLKPAVNRAIARFCDIPVKQITAKDINNFIIYFAKQGRAHKTVLTQLQAIRQILSHALLCGDIQYNPADSVSIPRNLPKTEREPPSPDTIKYIREHTDLPFALFALFALYTGARRGEILALQYKDIDRANGYVHIYKSVYYDSNKPYIKTPKTKSGIRDVILLPALAKLIPQGTPEDYIFSENGGIITNKRFETCWKKYISFLPEHVTPHQLRHAYATRLYELDVDVKSAQDQLGHSDIKTTANIYTHVSEQKRKLTAKKLSKF